MLNNNRKSIVIKGTFLKMDISYALPTGTNNILDFNPRRTPSQEYHLLNISFYLWAPDSRPTLSTTSVPVTGHRLLEQSVFLISMHHGRTSISIKKKRYEGITFTIRRWLLSILFLYFSIFHSTEIRI